MPDRTLAEAVGDIRLSDSKFASDFAAIRARMLAAVTQLEKDSAITVGFRIDEDQIVNEFAKLEQHAADFAPVAKLRIDSDAAVADLAALSGLADPVVVKVNTDAAVADVAKLTNVVLDPLVVKANVEPAAADIASLAADPPAVQIPLTIDTSEVDGQANKIAARLAAVNASIGLTVDPKQAITEGDRAKDRLDALRASIGLDVVHQQADDAIAAVKAEADSLPPVFEKAGTESGSRFAAGLKKAASGVASAIGVAGGGFIAGALVSGFERLNTIEDATASLTVQLGNAGDAAKLLGQVLDVVKGTPFNLDQFAKAAANMVSFGIETKKIPGYLTAIGEAAASQGGRANEVAQRLSLIFGQVSTANRISGQELLQFSEAGVNALAILGNHFHKTTTEIRDMISSGVVPAKEALDVLADGILHGTKGIAGTTVAFAGTMAKLRETLSGSIGGFKAATARFGVELIEPFKEGLVAAFNGATSVIDDFGKKVHTALAGIGSSGIGKELVESLKDLPALVSKVSEGLSSIGPAIAPLAGFIGASGLGSLKEVLGSLGRFIPAISPVGAAIASFVVFTPQIRDELFPVVVKLVKIVGEAGAVFGVVAGKVTTALIPVFVNLAHVADGLVPMAENVLKFGEGLAAIVVPAIETFAGALAHVPVALLVGLATAFAAFKFASHDFEFLDKAAYNTGRLLTKFGVDADEAAGKGRKAMQGMEVAVAGAFAGMALSSKDGATQVTGALGSIGAIAAGFAIGGVAGPLAIAGVAIGAIGGLFVENARAAAALKKEITDLGQSLADQTKDLLKDNDALTLWLGLSAQARGDVSIGSVFLDDSKKGKELAGTLAALGVASAGPAGEGVLGGMLVDLQKFNGDISKSPTLMNTLTTSFGVHAGTVARVVTAYQAAGRSFEDLQRELNNVQEHGSEGMPVAGVTTADLKEISDLLGPDGDLRGRLDDTFNAIFKILHMSGDPGSDVTAIARQQLKDLLAQSPQFKAAFDLETAGQKDLNIETLNYAQILALVNRAQEIAGGKDKDITVAMLRHTQIVNELTGQTIVLGGVQQKVTTDMIAMWQKLADSMGVDILDVVPAEMRPFVQDILDADAAAKKLKEDLGGAAAPLDAATQAAKNLADAVLLSKTATTAVTDEVDRLKAKLDDTTSAQNFAAALRGVVTTLSTVTNEADIKQGAQLDKSIASQREKIAGLQIDVQREFEQASAKRVALGDQLEIARAHGAVGGVALIEAELKAVDDKAKAKQADLDKAQAELADFSAQLTALGSLVPKTVLGVLADQAKFAGMSMFDFLVAAPTPEAIAEFQGQVIPLVDKAQKQFTDEVAKHPENAKAIGIALRKQLLDQFIAGGLDPKTAQQLVDSTFDVSKLGPDLQRQAKAAQVKYTADLRKSFEDDTQLGVLAKAVIAGGKGGDPEARKALRDQLQAEFDKHNLEIGVEPRALTDADVAKLAGFTVEAIVPLKSLDVTSPSVTVTTGTLIVQTGVPPSTQVTSGSILPHLISPRAGGGVPQREGGVLTESHIAQIVAAGAYRVFAEPETYGEGYVPLSPFKRQRSLQIMGQIADMFGHTLEPKSKQKMVLPSVMTGGVGAVAVDADAIGRAVARHSATATARRLGDGYDHAVHVEPGAIIVHAAPDPKRTATRIVSSLAELALRHR